jgi:hypothetical protein
MHDTLGGRYEAGAIARSEHIPESTRSFSACMIGTLNALAVSAVETQAKWIANVCTLENGHDPTALTRTSSRVFRKICFCRIVAE